MSGRDVLSSFTLQDQLYARIKATIESGELRPGDKLPSEMMLCERYGVSRVTVRNALAQLVADGLIVKKQGKGAFVRPAMHVENDFSDGSFTTSCRAMGSTPSTKVIRTVMHDTLPPDAARLAGDFPSEGCIEIVRLRFVDDDPCILEHDYLPETYDFALTRDCGSLLRLVLEHTGRIAVEFDDQFSIARANKEQAQFLLCESGRPLLKVDQRVLDTNNGLIYVNTQLIVTEKYTYAVQSAH